MSGPDSEIEAERRKIAGQWSAIAFEDIRVVRACLDLNEPVLGPAAYHCQQAAEKAIKGLLVLAGADLRKTHDLDELAELAVPHYPALKAQLDAIRSLTPWSYAYRYPATEEIPPEPSAAQVRAALIPIEHVAEALRVQLRQSEGESGSVPRR